MSEAIPWSEFVRTEGATVDDLRHPGVLAALSRQTMLDIRRASLVQVEALLAAGWRYELPREDLEPWQWYWRAPPKRPGKPGRKYLSTNQAFNAMRRSTEAK